VSSLDEPFIVGSRARVRFRTGLRLRFTLVEVEEGSVLTDESRLPGARMGHRQELHPLDGSDGQAVGVRLVKTIYIRGPLARLWAPILGPQAKKGLPGWQRRAADLAAAGGSPAAGADVT
jgi:hypothetical protein